MKMSRWKYFRDSPQLWRFSSWTNLKCRLLIVTVLASAILPAPTSACAPGRGAYRRQNSRKLTPLVFKQHVPNLSENTLGASGLSEGKITREDPRFQQLVPNYNTDIIFKDEEGTGADRLMTQRCKEKLNTLAISVMNQWPGVKLRVTEGWDEEGLHALNSLHYEGRAVDITTSDRDRSKYGMLARLAVEAGFDWVYYESRAHIHASVKSESSQAARHGGCFPPDATVTLQQGAKKKMIDLQVGEKILSMDNDGNLFYSQVLLFLDRNSTEDRQFVTLQTEQGRKISLTASHLIYAILRDDFLEDIDFEENLISTEDDTNLMQKLNITLPQVKTRLQATFAYKVKVGDWILVADEGLQRAELQRVSHVGSTALRGVYAPLTSAGNVVVDDVVASCYAVIDDQSIAHMVFAPVRLMNNIQEGFSHFWTSVQKTLHWWDSSAAGRRIDIKPIDVKETGIHWYASVLYKIARIVLPSHLVYT